MESVSEKDKYKQHIFRKIIFLTVMLLLLVTAAIISISVGASSINGFDVIRTIFRDPTITPAQRQIIVLIRFPRIVAAITAGIALSCSGLLMQGIFQNPLVSPYTLGISNGAAFGAALAIVFGSSFGFAGQYLIPASAFTFAILTMVLVYLISKVSANNTKTLVLSGVAVGYLFSALVSSMKYICDTKQLPELVFWTMGGLTGIPWSAIGLMGVCVVMGVTVMMVFAWDLNVMASGEEMALSLGVNYKKIRNISFVVCTLMTSVAVAFTGVIGFVGLIAPHLTKMLIGNDYRYSIPGSALVGGLLLLIADTVARNIFAPIEIPVGIITSVIGVPFFLYLIIKKRR